MLPKACFDHTRRISQRELSCRFGMHHPVQVQSSEIVAACKARSITVTTAWHAAGILATTAISKASSETASSRYVSFANFDLRAYLSRSDSSSSQRKDIAEALLCFHSAVSTNISVSETSDAQQAFHAIIPQLQHFYSHGLSDTTIIGIEHLTAYAHVMGETFASARFRALLQSSQVWACLRTS